MTRIFTAFLPLLPLAMAPSVGDSNVVVMWILGLAGVAVIFNQVATAWKTMTTGLKEQPTPSQTYATKSDCATRHTNMEQRDSEREARHEAQVTAIHNRINQVLAAVSRLEGRVG